MRDGIFRLQYQTPNLSATAALVISGGALSGADRHFFMVGRCQYRGNRFRGTLRFTRHTARPGSEQLPETFDVVIDGIGGEDSAQLDLRCPEIAAFKGKGTLRWLASQKLS